MCLELRLLVWLLHGQYNLIPEHCRSHFLNDTLSIMTWSVTVLMVQYTSLVAWADPEKVSNLAMYCHMAAIGRANKI